MLLFILFFNIQNINAENALNCSNQTITLGQMVNADVPTWRLEPGTFENPQRCVYKIFVPTFYTVEVTVALSNFSGGHFFSVSDDYGTLISSDRDGSLSYTLEFPYPSVTVEIAVGNDIDPDEPPTLNDLIIRSIKHQSFSSTLTANSTQNVSLNADGPVIQLFDFPNNSAFLFHGDQANVTLHPLWYPTFEVQIYLANVHVYLFKGKDFYIIGTLFASEHLKELKDDPTFDWQRVGIFLVREFKQEAVLVATNDKNTAYYKSWTWTYAVIDPAGPERGPDICLNASAGPVAYTVFSVFSIFDRFHAPAALQDLCVSQMTSSGVIPEVKFYLGTPFNHSQIEPFAIFSGDPNELPQKLIKFSKTLVIDHGDVCITTYNNPIPGKYNIMYPGRKGWLRGEVPVGADPAAPGFKQFHFFTDANATAKTLRWNFTINRTRSSIILPSFNPNITVILNCQMGGVPTVTELSWSEEDEGRLSIVFDAEKVDGFMYPSKPGTLWVDYFAEKSPIIVVPTTTKTTTTTRTTTTTIKTTSLTTATPGTNEESEEGEGSSAWVTVGIVVAVLAVLLLIAAIGAAVFIFFYRIKKKQNRTTVQKTGNEPKLSTTASRSQTAPPTNERAVRGAMPPTRRAFLAAVN